MKLAMNNLERNLPIMEPRAGLRKDAGFLSYKDHLPVSQVVVGDTDRQGSEAKLSVGPLRCQGDNVNSGAWTPRGSSSRKSYTHLNPESTLTLWLSNLGSKLLEINVVEETLVRDGEGGQLRPEVSPLTHTPSQQEHCGERKDMLYSQLPE
ncbi:Contactin-associated protein-like 2 [Galemys pyrenaicus]|uniref:Contactin-associated protein-like 2 n=1 Tax=Galemys pyrenaicus TaxID=202257 RepID=A0A8J5ZZX2_GALPY|nr:Contactin-associated protein-like 2 [Galemys pyrenaicus]